MSPPRVTSGPQPSPATGTVSTPASRAARLARDIDARQSGIELALLGVAALVVGLAVLHVWLAQARRAGAVEADLAAGRAVMVGPGTRAAALSPLLTSIERDSERQFVARTIASALTPGHPTAIDPLRQIGDLARIRIAARTIDARRDVPALSARLRTMRLGRMNVDSIRLLDADDLRALRASAAVRTAAEFGWRLVLAALLLVAAFFAAHVIRRLLGVSGDAVIVPIVFLLCGLGFVTMASVNDAVRDRLLFEPFAWGCALGAPLLAAASAVDFRRLGVDRLAFVFLAAALVASALLLTFGSGPGASGVKVNLLGVQPVEAIRPLIALFLAGYFARRWEMVRELRESRVAGSTILRRVSLPRWTDLQPVVVGMALVLVFFFLQRDLGPALVMSLVFLAVYSIARDRWLFAVAGLAILGAGFAAGYLAGYPSTVVRRVEMWRAPWDNAISGGDQVAHSLWALASGGLLGSGSGASGAGYIPTGQNDLVLASLGEDLGFVGLAAIFALFAVFIVRTLRRARETDVAYVAFLIAGLVTSLVGQMLLIAAGLLGLAPLSGVVTPFLSLGRSSMLSNLAVVGLLLASVRLAVPSESRPFARPIGVLRNVLLVAILALVVRAFVVQVVDRNETMARPVRTRQADGVQRFQDNPRLREAAQWLTRGTISDRNGLPLATSDGREIDKARAAVEAAGARISLNCPDPRARCYPWGGVTFAILGDGVTRANWAASNTDYVERRLDEHLRGFGSRTVAGERLPDYASLIPLWDHRNDLSHPAARRLFERVGDAGLTIDARLQWQIGRLLEARLAKLNLSRGAVVVIDGTSGDVLASVSHPWPLPIRGRVRVGDILPADSPALLDRARFGQYPPGSTFKLVTAAAALRAPGRLEERTFMCRNLPDGRVGQNLAGWRRPVRDDPADRSPHGHVAFDEGIVVSCNAYFAQLGLAVGARPLREAAAQFEVQTAVPDTVERLRGQLPWASYGQGEVVASPFRMARVAATFGASGIMPHGQVIAAPAEADSSGTRRILTPAQAERVAQAMRQVVLRGTARSLLTTMGSDGGDIAGKTGTAEVAGARSHAWFVGFAPASAGAERRIAFAVLIENGGYGGDAAVPLAGDIVTAARKLGVIK